MTRDSSIDWKDQCEIGIARRPLADQVEVPELGDFIAPEFKAHRLRHSKAVDVEDSAAHAELRDVVDHGNTLEPDRFEVSGERLGSSRVTLAKLESRLSERARQLRFLEESSRGGEKNSYFATADSFECLDTLTRYFGVRLDFAESLARWVEGDRSSVERLQISEPALSP
jgi:hypothetical protein